MKKFYLLLMALALGSSAFAGIVITTTVTIGKKSQNCVGFGICSAQKTTSYTDGSVNGTLDIDEVRGSLILSISKTDLQNVQPDKLVFFTNKSEVLITEDFAFSTEINTAVQVSKPLVIKKGEYNLTLLNGSYYIEIPL
jgi:hypothetical protein